MENSNEIGSGRIATAEEIRRFEEAWSHPDGCICAVCKSVAGMVLFFPEPIKIKSGEKKSKARLNNETKNPN